MLYTNISFRINDADDSAGWFPPSPLKFGGQPQDVLADFVQTAVHGKVHVVAEQPSGRNEEVKGGEERVRHTVQMRGVGVKYTYMPGPPLLNVYKSCM